MSARDFRIVAHPDFKTVPPGARVSYHAHLEGVDEDAELEDYEFAWFCVNDAVAVKELDKHPVIPGPSTRHWTGAQWAFSGRHEILLQVIDPDGISFLHSRAQWVDSAHNILGREFDPTANDRFPGPFQVLAHKEVYLQALLDIAKVKPPPPSKKDAHEQTIEQVKVYIENLKFLLDELDGKEAYAVDAMHIDRKRSTRSQLLLWLVNISSEADDPEWMLVDWTNPTYQYTSGRYDDDGDTHQEAIEDVIDEWDSGNRYPDGLITYDFRVPSRDVQVSGEFETDGASLGDSVSKWLDYAALGGAVVAGVVTLVAPVPGSRVASAAIWTSIFTSTAAATINIAQRHAEGHGNWKDDAFDGLSIIGNLFAGAGMAWKIGAQVTSATKLGAKMSKAVLIGQISTDGLQGILLGHSYLGDYQSIMDDPSLSPDERLKKLMALFSSATVAGAMTYISVKGAKGDLENLNKNRTVFSKSKVEDPNTVIDLDNPVSSVPIKGSDTKVKTHVETEGGSRELGTQSKRSLDGGPPASKTEALEGHRDVDVYDPETGDRITDIDHIEDGVLWEEKTAGDSRVPDPEAWIDKHLRGKKGKIEKYLRAREHLEGYEDAPIGLDFLNPNATIEFRAAVEEAVAELRTKYPNVELKLRWK